MFVGQPLAGITEVLIEEAHHEVNRAARGAADEAAEGVLADLKRQTCVVVVMKRAEALVAHHPQSESLRDPLNRQVAKLLQFKFINHVILRFYYFTILQVVLPSLGEGLGVGPHLGIQSRQLVVGDELTMQPLVKLVLGALLALANL